MEEGRVPRASERQERHTRGHFPLSKPTGGTRGTECEEPLAKGFAGASSYIPLVPSAYLCLIWGPEFLEFSSVKNKSASLNHLHNLRGTQHDDYPTMSVLLN